MELRDLVIQKIEGQTKNRVRKTLSDLPPIDSLLNVKKAAKLIHEALTKGKRVLIVGDYDADGIMATTILFGFLRDIGFNDDQIGYIIPSRLRDGYGLSKNIIDYALEEEYETIITVDNGIAAVEAIQYGKDNGLDIVVTDHHTVPPVMPNADVIVCPKQKGETFPFIEISGATVAWYFIAALREVFDAQIDLRKYLDFVAITVISDVMPLNDINLGILQYGLNKIKRQERYIYRLLWSQWSINTLDEVDISFSLVPMINAIGRIDDANNAVEMFLSRDMTFIEDMFHYTVDVNEKRKTMTREYVDIATMDLAESFDSNKKAVIFKHKDYHEGIIGIVAGKLAEIFQRPAYVFGWNEEKGIWKGSARSAGDIHLYQLTKEAKDDILGFGGHKGAVGLAVHPDNFDAFQKSIEDAADKIDDSLFIDESREAIPCQLEEIDMKLMDVLESYGPFGQGNPQVLFKTSATVRVEREMKDGLHFKCKLISDAGHSMTGLFFNVKKEMFLSQIDKKDPEFTFYPKKNYNPKDKTYSIEVMCDIIT